MKHAVMDVKNAVTGPAMTFAICSGFAVAVAAISLMNEYLNLVMLF